MGNLDPQTIIAVCSLLVGLSLVFNLLLSPIKKDIAKLEAGQVKLEAGQVKLEKKIDQLLSQK